MRRPSRPDLEQDFRVNPLIASILLVVSGSAFGQNSPAPVRTLPEVRVTTPAETPYKPEIGSSPKLTAPLRETPKSITVIPQALIEERGANSLADVLRTTPGITLGSGEGGTPTGDRPFIRGFEASTDISIDGVRDLGRFQHEAFNIESIEIMKGPSSAFGGRGSTGGGINLVSKTPRDENFVNGGVGVGTDNTVRATVDANQVLEGIGALRLNAMKQEGDVAGRDEVDTNRWGLAPSLTLGTGPTRVTLSYYLLESKDLPDLGHPFDTINGTGLPVDVRSSNFYGAANRDFRKNDSNLATVAFEHDFSNGLKLRNLARHGKSLNQYLVTRPTIHLPTGLVTRDLRSRNSETETVVNQTDLSGNFDLAGMRHQFAVGVELGRETIRTGTITGAGMPRTDLLNPTPRDPYPGPTVIGGRDTLAGKTSTRSAYVFDTVSLSKQFDINAGLRYDDYRVRSETLVNDSGFLNYQLGLVYKPTTIGSVYVSFGTSSNPSGETLGQSGGADGAAGGNLTEANANLDPERSRSIELGTKWDVLNERLALSAAVFKTEKRNQRATDPITDTVELIGNSEVTGIEFGAAGSITPAWSVFAGYTYLDPELKDDGAGTNDGKQLKYIARQGFSLWSTYRVMPALTVGGGAYYMSKRYVNDANTLQLPSYWRFDAMAAYRVNKNLELQLNVINLADEVIYDGSHVGLFANVAPGRSAMLTARLNF